MQNDSCHLTEEQRRMLMEMFADDYRDLSEKAANRRDVWRSACKNGVIFWFACGASLLFSIGCVALSRLMDIPLIAAFVLAPIMFLLIFGFDIALVSSFIGFMHRDPELSPYACIRDHRFTCSEITVRLKTSGTGRFPKLITDDKGVAYQCPFPQDYDLVQYDDTMIGIETAGKDHFAVRAAAEGMPFESPPEAFQIPAEPEQYPPDQNLTGGF